MPGLSRMTKGLDKTFCIWFCMNAQSLSPKLKKNLGTESPPLPFSLFFFFNIYTPLFPSCPNKFFNQGGEKPEHGKFQMLFFFCWGWGGSNFSSSFHQIFCVLVSACSFGRKPPNTCVPAFKVFSIAKDEIRAEIPQVLLVTADHKPSL